jgi:hypothetical protein
VATSCVDHLYETFLCAAGPCSTTGSSALLGAKFVGRCPWSLFVPDNQSDAKNMQMDAFSVHSQNISFVSGYSDSLVRWQTSQEVAHWPADRDC